MNPFIETMRPVWENAEFVTVDRNALARLAQTLKNEKLEIPNWRMPCLPKEDDENFVQFLGVVTAINFCFWDPWTKERYRYVDKTGKEWQGAMAMTMAMKEAMDEGAPILDGNWLARISRSTLSEILEKDSRIPLLNERIGILRELGSEHFMHGKSGGKFFSLLERAGFRVFNPKEMDGDRGIVARLVGNFPFSFQDTANHPLTRFQSSAKKRSIHFAKKAQLFAMMYHGRALDSGGKLPLIRDIENIGVVADYVLPKILRYFGVLVYSPELAQRVDNWEIVEEHSPEEVEIRAQTWQAVILLRDRLSKLRGENVSMLALDYLLWRKGRMIDVPHHLTPTTAY